MHKTNFKPNVTSPIKIATAYVTVLIVILQSISQLTLLLVGNSRIAYPWTFIATLHVGLITETIIAALSVIGLCLIGLGIKKGGMNRYLAQIFGIGVIGITAVFLFGFEVFCYRYYGISQKPNLLWSLFLNRFEEYDMWMSFLQTETVVFIIMVVATAYLIFERIKPSNNALGNAHFANGFEIHKTGFLKSEDQSIIIGKKYGAPLYSNGFEHVLVFAPTGSGKTRSIAIPNLFNYPYSVVCNDVKFTLFETTSGFRQNQLGNACFCFAPARQTGITHRYNPLDFITHDKQHRMTDIQRIAHIFIPDNQKDPIWGQTSRQLFKALILFLLDSPDKQATFGEMSRLVKQEQFDLWFKQQLDETDHFDAEFYRNGYAYINTPDKTRGNILISFIGHFELFDDPIIDAATSGSDFDLRNLRRQKMTIYVGFTDEDMERLSPLLTLFWQQLISFMIKEIPNTIEEPYPLLCLIDEFSSLGRLERLRRSLKLLREYRVRCILMFQYIAQTYEKYSHDEAKAFTNIKTKVAYTTEDITDAEFISKMLGTRTKRVISHSMSNQQNGNSNSRNISYQAIPLLRADEIMKLSPNVSLIIRSGSSPIKTHQWIWYEENSMKRLSCAPSDVPKQEVTHYPFVRTFLMTEKSTQNSSYCVED